MPTRKQFQQLLESDNEFFLGKDPRAFESPCSARPCSEGVYVGKIGIDSENKDLKITVDQQTEKPEA